MKNNKSVSKRVLSLVMSVVLVVSTFMSVMVVDAAAVTVPGPNLQYTFDSNTGTLTISGQGDMYDFRDTNLGLNHQVPWTSVKEQIKTVIVEEGVTGIGEYSFFKCENLTSVQLPSTLKIIRGAGATGGYAGTNTLSYGAFRQCVSLESIVFPEGLETIEAVAFRECTSLKKVVLPDSLTSLGTGAFVNCSGLAEVTFGSGLTEIPVECFYNCSNLATINWGPTVSDVGEWAFYNSRLTSIKIPEQITKISGRGFADSFHLRDAYIYNRDCSIAELAFNNTKLTSTQEFTVHGYTGSTAQAHAESRGYAFVPLDACTHENTHIDIITPATCTTDGQQQVYCDDCDTVISTSTIKATGHNYEVLSTQDDTEVDGHIREFTKCSLCGDEKTVPKHVETEESGTVNKKYVWVDGYYTYDCNATCTSAGWEKYTCTVEGCGVTQRNAVASTGHTVDNWVVTSQATCTQEGSRTGHCSVCDQDVTEAIPMADHTIDLENPARTEDKTDVDGHIYKYYTCTVCGTETCQTEHTAWIEGEYTPTIIVNVTCTTNGLRRDKCDICGETRNVTLEAVGSHDWLATQTIEPTCTTKGQTNYTCQACGATKKDNVVDALGHNYVLQTDKNVISTCTEDGSKTYLCSRCSSEKVEVVPAKGHLSYANQRVIDTPADCENAGSGHATCVRCSEYYEFVIDPLGHAYENVEVEIADKPGHVLSTPTCTREGCTQKETSEIVHKEWIEGYYKHTVITQANCLTGEIYVDTCDLCNLSTGNQQGAPLAHEYQLVRVYNEPSSSQISGSLNVEPYSVIYSCKHCGRLDTKTGAWLYSMWSIYYYNQVPDKRVDINNISYMDVNGDNFVNAKDYALIYQLNKKYLKYQEELSQAGDTSDTGTTTDNGDASGTEDTQTTDSSVAQAAASAEVYQKEA